MLVIQRRVNETIQIGEAKITITAFDGAKVKIGIEAPPHVKVTRPDDVKFKAMKTEVAK